MFKLKNVKRYCFYCNKSFPFDKGVRIIHPKQGVKTIHKSCAKKLLEEDTGWRLYTI